MPEGDAVVFHDPEPDVLGPGYEAITMDLPGDAEGPVRATLVRYTPPDSVAPRAKGAPLRAVLYVHGFADYFFQTELAEFHAARGEQFYAIDLRKYGRSLRPWQTPYLMADVSDYYQELDAAVEYLQRAGHESVLLSAHSTGGLTGPMWLGQRQSRLGTLEPIGAVLLNSPFLHVPASTTLRTVAVPTIHALARRRPLAVIPSFGPSFYNQSIHASARGEWVMNQEWKPATGGVMRAGWLAAALRATSTLQRGLALDCPVLVLCSAKTIRARQWGDELFTGDAVLDADAVAHWSTSLGGHVTCIRVQNGMHDLLLSREPVRKKVFGEMRAWLDYAGFR
jgi:alpha-beta hydrolase superfamily lysophospholipase